MWCEGLSLEEFLKSFCKCDETCNINYKPYEYGTFVESIPFKKALEKFISDFEEVKDFFCVWYFRRNESV